MLSNQLMKLLAMTGLVVVLSACSGGEESSDSVTDGSSEVVDGGSGGENSGNGEGEGEGGGGDNNGGESGGTGGDAQQGPAPAIGSCEDGESIERQLRLLTKSEYQNSINDLLSINVDVGGQVPADAINAEYSNYSATMVLTARHVDDYMAFAETVVEQGIDQNTVRNLSNNCDFNQNADQCKQQFVDTFGKRVYRRPLDNDERTRLLSMYDNSAVAGDFIAGSKLAATAMLTSPKFLYRSEMGTKSDNGYALSGFELATQLSYMLWGTTPDQTLLDAAQNGQLDNNDGLMQQAQRLLNDDRAKDHFVKFVDEWIGTKEMVEVTKDNQAYPNFNDDIRRDMIQEVKSFVSHVVFDSDNASISELLTADYTFLNQRLANYYGINGVTSQEFSQVDTAGQRGGLMLLGAFHAVHAKPNETAPVQRGAFFRERIMCQALPVENAVASDEDRAEIDLSLPVRERFQVLVDTPQCYGCHQFINEVGFAFEKFDGAGQFRDTEDDSGLLVGLETLFDGEKLEFAGPKALSDLIAGTEQSATCFVTQYLDYATGTGGEATEKQADCATKSLAANFSSTSDIKTLILEYVASEHFKNRAGF
ncbi:MAG: DUF1592 domain-containing protein [Pseudomonadota bacterium]